MIRLIIIADDFTGGLDTGVQFSQKGIRTRVVTDWKTDYLQAAGECQVLVIVSETRHLSSSEAARIVSAIVRKAVAPDIPFIYKKTDSGLRGNIGAELSAALNAGAEFITFFSISRFQENCCNGVVNCSSQNDPTCGAILKARFCQKYLFKP